MARDEYRDEPDPAEVQPTDNSSGTPVDLERLEEVQEQAPPSDKADH